MVRRRVSGPLACPIWRSTPCKFHWFNYCSFSKLPLQNINISNPLIQHINISNPSLQNIINSKQPHNISIFQIRRTKGIKISNRSLRNINISNPPLQHINISGPPLHNLNNSNSRLQKYQHFKSDAPKY